MLGTVNDESDGRAVSVLRLALAVPFAPNLATLVALRLRGKH